VLYTKTKTKRLKNKMMPLQKAKKIKKRLTMQKKGRTKGYVKNPTQFSFRFLIERLKEEVEELEMQFVNLPLGTQEKWKQDTLFEIADVSNMADFIYGKLKRDFERKQKSEK